MKIPAWIYIKADVQPNVFKCGRCGATRPVYLPAAVDDFQKQAQAFAESHRYCKE